MTKLRLRPKVEMARETLKVSRHTTRINSSQTRAVCTGRVYHYTDSYWEGQNWTISRWERLLLARSTLSIVGVSSVTEQTARRRKLYDVKRWSYAIYPILNSAVEDLFCKMQLTNHCFLQTRHLATCLGPGDMHFSCLHACIIYMRNHLSLVVCLSF